VPIGNLRSLSSRVGGGVALFNFGQISNLVGGDEQSTVVESQLQLALHPRDDRFAKIPSMAKSRRSIATKSGI